MPQLRAIQKLLVPHNSNEGDGASSLDNHLLNSCFRACCWTRRANEILQKAQIYQESHDYHRWNGCNRLV